MLTVILIVIIIYLLYLLNLKNKKTVDVKIKSDSEEKEDINGIKNKYNGVEPSDIFIAEQGIVYV